MHHLPKIFFRWGTAILYMTVCPVFYFVFILIYEPLRLRQYLDMGRDLYSMNLAISFSISLSPNTSAASCNSQEHTMSCP